MFTTMWTKEFMLLVFTEQTHLEECGLVVKPKSFLFLLVKSCVSCVTPSVCADVLSFFPAYSPQDEFVPPCVVRARRQSVQMNSTCSVAC